MIHLEANAFARIVRQSNRKQKSMKAEISQTVKTSANSGKTLNVLGLLICLGAMPLFRSALAQPAPAEVRFFKDSALPQAVVLSLNGQSTFSQDSPEFKKLKVGDVLNQGAVIRTDQNARVDLFFRRMAITVRVTSDTELGLETMTKSRQGDVLVVQTILDLRKGGIFCFVRGLVADSKFEVKHKIGRSVVEGEGASGFEIRADSAAVSGRLNFVPLKVISENGTAVLAPGHKFDAKIGKVMRLAPSEEEVPLLQLDELQALNDLLTPPEELPPKR
jgi:hypothetical protein